MSENDVVISIRLPRELHRATKSRAEAHGTTLTQWIRLALKNYRYLSAGQNAVRAPLAAPAAKLKRPGWPKPHPEFTTDPDFDGPLDPDYVYDPKALEREQVAAGRMRTQAAAEADDEALDL